LPPSPRACGPAGGDAGEGFEGVGRSYDAIRGFPARLLPRLPVPPLACEHEGGPAWRERKKTERHSCTRARGTSGLQEWPHSPPLRGSGLCSWHIAPKPKNLSPQLLPAYLPRSGGFVPRIGRSLAPRTDYSSRVVALSRYRAPVFRNCPRPILRCCGLTSEKTSSCPGRCLMPPLFPERVRRPSFLPFHGPGASLLAPGIKSR